MSRGGVVCVWVVKDELVLCVFESRIKPPPFFLESVRGGVSGVLGKGAPFEMGWVEAVGVVAKVHCNVIGVFGFGCAGGGGGLCGSGSCCWVYGFFCWGLP